jgi:hypothetical protein
MRKGDLEIELSLLPGLVRRKWIEKKRKMQRVADQSFAGLCLFPEDEGLLFQGGAVSANDWMLPNSRIELAKMTTGSFNKPFPVYEIPEPMLTQKISLHQLQRLMDEDPTLPLLLGHTKAVKVVRKFQRPGAGGMEEEDDYARDDESDDGKQDMRAPVGVNQITNTQAEVFAKIDTLERIPPELEVPKVPAVQHLTEEMSGALTDVQNQFRVQLTGIIEATATLFEHLVELTRAVDSIRANNSDVLDMVREQAADMALTTSSQVS